MVCVGVVIVVVGCRGQTQPNTPTGQQGNHLLGTLSPTTSSSWFSDHQSVARPPVGLGSAAPRGTNIYTGCGVRPWVDREGKKHPPREPRMCTRMEGGSAGAGYSPAATDHPARYHQCYYHHHHHHHYM